MILHQVIYFALALSAFHASAASSYEVKIELIQLEEATKSLVLKSTSSKCQIEFGGKNTDLKKETCQQLFQKYASILQKDRNLVDQVGHHGPFYLLTVKQDAKTWTIKTNVTDFQICESKNKCTAVSGTNLRKFISEVNSLIR